MNRLLLNELSPQILLAHASVALDISLVLVSNHALFMVWVLHIDLVIHILKALVSSLRILQVQTF